MIAKFDGQLEIDTRGIIYFHSAETGHTILRICRLPVPIPVGGEYPFLDITHMHGTGWDARMKYQKEEVKEMEIKKCIVFGCENKTMGDLCELCREMLMTGKVNNVVRRTFIHEINRKLNSLKGVLKLIRDDIDLEYFGREEE